MIVKVLLAVVSFLGPFSAFASQGGARDGGGGNTLPGQKVDPPAITDIMQDSVPVVFAAYANLSRSFAEAHTADPQADPIEKTLFAGSRTIFDVLLNTKVQENMTSACRSPLGEEDGAGPGSTPDSICISVFRLAQKLTIDNAASQTEALMAREYSHLLGVGEDDATWIQNELYEMMPQYSGASATVLEGMQQIGTVLPQVQSAAISPNFNSSTCSVLSSIQSGYLRLQTVSLPSAGLSLLDLLAIDDYRLYQGNAYRLNYLIAATCSQSLAPYSQAFQGKDQLSLPELEKLSNESYPNLTAPSFMIKNILDKSSTSKLQGEISALAQFLTQLQSELQTLETVEP